MIEIKSPALSLPNLPLRSSFTVSCPPIQCAPPGPDNLPSNSYIDQSAIKSSYGSQELVKITCARGYEIKGTGNIQCQPQSGGWKLGNDSTCGRLRKPRELRLSRGNIETLSLPQEVKWHFELKYRQTNCPQTNSQTNKQTNTNKFSNKQTQTNSLCLSTNKFCPQTNSLSPTKAWNDQGLTNSFSTNENWNDTLEGWT